MPTIIPGKPTLNETAALRNQVQSLLEDVATMQKNETRAVRREQIWSDNFKHVQERHKQAIRHVKGLRTILEEFLGRARLRRNEQTEIATSLLSSQTDSEHPGSLVLANATAKDNEDPNVESRPSFRDAMLARCSARLKPAGAGKHYQLSLEGSEQPDGQVDQLLEQFLRDEVDVLSEFVVGVDRFIEQTKNTASLNLRCQKGMRASS
jgi:hypothetical protein